MKQRKKLVNILAVILLIVFFAGTAFCDVRLPAIIGNNMVLQQQSNVNIWGWADAGEKVTVNVSWQQLSGVSTIADEDGKWKVKVNTPKAGGPYTLHIKGNNEIRLQNILIGEVWICSGQSNMQWSVKRSSNAEEGIAAADLPQIRLFEVKREIADQPKDDCSGKWVQCSSETVQDFSAVAYYFGREIHQKLDVPVGLVVSCWGGTPIESWVRKDVLQSDSDFMPILDRYHEVMKDYPETKKEYDEVIIPKWKRQAGKAKAEGKPVPKKPRIPMGPEHMERPNGLYNAMIAPLIQFTIKGVIWYQGESNAQRAHQYRRLFPAMIESWRKDWAQGQFPFYYVQIAPFNYWPGYIGFELREAQLMALSVPKTGMVVTMDIGEADNIHPKNKMDVGKRLSLWALAKDYGFEDIIYSGPLYKSMKVEGDKIRISFDHIGSGLMAKDGPLKNFTIAGSDKKFVKAKAEIQGDTIVVFSPSVKKSVAVRCGWSETAMPNLFNKESLPASPFRTDDWKGLTYGKN